jgi:signal transduction histidine kinase
MPASNLTSLDFEAIFSATASAYLMLDTSLTIVGVNDAYLRATERTRESVMGRYVFDAFPTNPSEPGTSGVSILQRSLERVIATGTADHVDMLRFDIPVGTGLNVKFETRYWSPINSPVFDRNGELTHVIHNAIDITRQVESENARRESERRFKALTDASGVIYRMSADWSHMHQLDGRGFLKDTSSIGEFRLDDYVAPEDQALVRKTINEAIRNNDIFELEHRVRRVDGSLGWTQSKAVPIRNTDGEIVEWIGAAVDITSRKVAEEQLKDTSRRKDEFLAMLSHELRNPLAPISAAAELLQLGRLNEARLTQISEIITRQVRHMTSLVDDLLDVSRVTSGLVTLALDAVEIKRVVGDAIEQVEPLIASRRHQVDVHLPPGAALVSGDAKRLVQIVSNLLNNAAKYTPEGGVIDLRVEVRNEQVTILVRDNGIGMAPEFVGRVFDMFSQAHRTADRSQGGLGIGLALVKSLVELHHGSITATSKGQGYGSEFTVWLPRHVAPDMQQPSSNRGGGNTRPVGLKVMVVDDNADAADMLAMYLETSGHEVIVENTSRTALERARRERADVFLLDIGLPDMDGNELARQLRSMPELASSCLIAVTGYGQEQDRKRTTEAGFDYHFVKPVNMTKLTSLLAELGTLALPRTN